MEVGWTGVRIAADISDFEAKMSRAQRAFSGLADRVGQIGQRLTTSITMPVTALGVGVVAAAARMDSLERGLLAVAGSSAEAAVQMKRLQDVAKLPGLGFSEAIEGSIALQAAGFSAKVAERALKAFGNALATVGKGKADLQGVQLALSQIASKGKISAEEINQLSERVPQIRKAMQAAFGTADTERLQRMGIGAEKFIAGIITELEKLPPVTGGISNAFENVRDAAFRTAAAIGRTLIPAVEQLTNRFADYLEKIEAADPGAVRWRISLLLVTAVMGPLAIGIAAVTTAVVALSTALSIGLMPIIITGGALLVSLGILVARWLNNKLAVGGFADEVARLRAQLGGLSEEQALAQFLGTDALMQELRARERLLTEQAQREKDAWTRVHGSPMPWNKDAGVSDATKEALATTRAEIDKLAPRLQALNEQYMELARARKAANQPPPPTPPDLGAEDKRVDTLIKAVELNRASNAHVDELMRKYDEFNRIAFDVTKPLDQQVAAFERMQEILAAMKSGMRDVGGFDVSKFMRGRLPGLRLPSAGTVRADDGPAREKSRLEQEITRLGTSITSKLKQLFDPRMMFTDLATNAFSALAGRAFSAIGNLFTTSEAEREQQRVQEANTNALERLGSGIARLGEVIAGTRGVAFGQLQTAAAGALSSFNPLRPASRDIDTLFQRELTKIGMSMDEARKIAAGMGIELDGTVESLAMFAAALREVDFGDLFNTATGQLERLQQGFRLFGTDQGGQLDALRDFFLEQANLPAEIEAQLAAFDLSSIDGLQGFKDLLGQIFTNLESMGFDSLGELSADQFIDLLLEMGGLTDALGKLGDEANKVAGALRNVPTGFKVALATFNATQGAQLNPAAIAGGVRMTRGETIYIDHVDVHGVEDPEAFYAATQRIARDKRRAGGVPVNL